MPKPFIAGKREEWSEPFEDEEGWSIAWVDANGQVTSKQSYASREEAVTGLAIERRERNLSSQG